MRKQFQTLLKEIDEAGTGSGRGRVTFYLDLEMVEVFKKKCSGRPASRVVEKLMQAFIEEKKRVRHVG